MLKLQLLVFGWLISTISYCSANSNIGPESCLGKNCLGKPNLTQQAFVASYGPGFRNKWGDDPERVYHCYYVPEMRAWLELGFTQDAKQHFRRTELFSLFITTAPICTKRVSLRVTSTNLFTERGVTLGMDEKDVIRRLGRPSRIDNAKERESRNPERFKDTKYSSRFGNRVLVYSIEESTFFNFIYLNDGKVRSMWLSDDE